MAGSTRSRRPARQTMTMSFAELQSHATSRPIELPMSARKLSAALRTQLTAASNAGAIVNSAGEITKRVTLLTELPPTLREDLRMRALDDHAFCILGGEKNQQRDRQVPHFERSDGAWFDFSITIRERNRQLELLAYDFEIRFPPGHGVPFLRF